MERALLITGTSGFIGMNFLEYLVSDPKSLLDRYSKVVSIDCMGYATKYNEKHYTDIIVEKNFYHLTSDINDTKLCERFNDSFPSYLWDVIDFASQSHVDNSIKSPFDIFNQNSTLSSSLVKMIRIKNINHFYHASTDEVYGEIPLSEKLKKTNWFKPWSNINPNNPYSASKAAQDCFLMSMKHTFGMGVTFFRMANQFGPWQHPEKMLPATILRAIKGDTIKIYGDGSNIRQWTPVVDTVKYIYEMLYEENKSDVIHLAHPNKLLNNNEVVEIWRKILREEWAIGTKIEYIEDRKGHDKMYALDKTPSTFYKDSDIVQRFKETIIFYIKNSQMFFKEYLK